jgi:hypothetical protein
MTYIDSRGKTHEAVSYSAALRKLHGLGADNQIDDHDIAGEEALEDQQQWQQEALDALDSFIAANETALDAISTEASSGDDYPRATWEADRAMDPTEPLNAIKIVFDMARHGSIDPEGPDAVEMEDEINEQQRALDMTFDLLGLHSDKVDSIATTFSA